MVGVSSVTLTPFTRLYMRKEQYQEVFLEVYDQSSDAVFRLCLSKTSSREEAKDLTQETFTKSWEYLMREDREVENMKAFVFTVARNLIKDYYKKKKSIPEKDLPPGTMESIPTQETATTLSEARIMLAALACLPEQYREVIQLHIIEGFPISEIADILDEKPNTISVRLKRGLEKIRAQLNI